MEDIRWKQRFQNLEKAYDVLDSVIADYRTDTEKISYKMAVIQAFEMLFELSWKTLKDYLNDGGILVNMPRDVIKEAFSAGLIKDGQVWIDMLSARNKTAHVYDEKETNEILALIVEQYFEEFTKLFNFFKGKI